MLIYKQFERSFERDMCYYKKIPSSYSAKLVNDFLGSSFCPRRKFIAIGVF